MLTCPCNVEPLTPHFYIVQLGLTFFLNSLGAVLTCSHDLCFEHSLEHFFSFENYQFCSCEILQYITYSCYHNDPDIHFQMSKFNVRRKRSIIRYTCYVVIVTLVIKIVHQMSGNSYLRQDRDKVIEPGIKEVQIFKSSFSYDLYSQHCHLSLVVRNPVFGVSDQV